MTTRDDRRLMLLDVARDVLLRFGYRKATLEDIAAEAGVSRATLYNYFPSKEEVFRAIITRETEALLEFTRNAVPPEATPRERLVWHLTAHFQRLEHLRALYVVSRSVARDVMGFALQELESFQSREREDIAAILRDGVARGAFRALDAEAVAAAVQASVRGLGEAFMFEDREVLERGMQPLLEILLDGLERKQEARS